jgi:hypothetical protein
VYIYILCILCIFCIIYIYICIIYIMYIYIILYIQSGSRYSMYIVHYCTMSGGQKHGEIRWLIASFNPTYIRGFHGSWLNCRVRVTPWRMPACSQVTSEAQPGHFTNVVVNVLLDIKQTSNMLDTHQNMPTTYRLYMGVS